MRTIQLLAVVLATVVLCGAVAGCNADTAAIKRAASKPIVAKPRVKAKPVSPPAVEKSPLKKIDAVASRQLAIFLQKKLQALMEFKDDPDFHFYGFGRDRPYSLWFQELQAKRVTIGQEHGLLPGLNEAAYGVLQSGMDYMRSRGKETDFTRWSIPRVKQTLREAIKLKARPLPSSPEYRQWTDSTGKYQAEAQFSGMIGSTVRLLKPNGKTVTLPLKKLSQADRKWIRDRGK